MSGRSLLLFTGLAVIFLYPAFAAARNIPNLAHPTLQRLAGQLLGVTGNVIVERSKQPRKGIPLFQLRRGDIVRVRPGGKAEVVLYANHYRFMLASGASAQVETTNLVRLAGVAPKPMGNIGVSDHGGDREPGKVLGTRVDGDHASVPGEDTDPTPIITEGDPDVGGPGNANPQPRDRNLPQHR